MAQAQSWEVSGRVGLQEHVSCRHQAEEESLALRRFEIKGNAALGGIIVPEVEAALRMRNVIEERAYRAGVLPAGRLDLDDVGTKVCHQFAAELALLVRKL